MLLMVIYFCFLIAKRCSYNVKVSYPVERQRNRVRTTVWF